MGGSCLPRTVIPGVWGSCDSRCGGQSGNQGVKLVFRGAQVQYRDSVRGVRLRSS